MKQAMHPPWAQSGICSQYGRSKTINILSIYRAFLQCEDVWMIQTLLPHLSDTPCSVHGNYVPFAPHKGDRNTQDGLRYQVVRQKNKYPSDYQEHP